VAKFSASGVGCQLGWRRSTNDKLSVLTTNQYHHWNLCGTVSAVAESRATLLGAFSTPEGKPLTRLIARPCKNNLPRELTTTCESVVSD
jgi:hypothetical protein